MGFFWESKHNTTEYNLYSIKDFSFYRCFVVVKAAMIKVPHKDKSLCPSVNNAALRVISKIGKATALWGVRR